MMLFQHFLLLHDNFASRRLWCHSKEMITYNASKVIFLITVMAIPGSSYGILTLQTNAWFLQQTHAQTRTTHPASHLDHRTWTTTSATSPWTAPCSLARFASLRGTLTNTWLAQYGWSLQWTPPVPVAPQTWAARGCSHQRGSCPKDCRIVHT